MVYSNFLMLLTNIFEQKFIFIIFATLTNIFNITSNILAYSNMPKCTLDPIISILINIGPNISEERSERALRMGSSFLQKVNELPADSGKYAVKFYVNQG